MDLLASASPEHYRRALSALIRDDQVDSILTIFIPPLVTDPEAVAAVIAAEARASTKPIAGIFMRADGTAGTSSVLRVSGVGRHRARSRDGVRAMETETNWHHPRAEGAATRRCASARRVSAGPWRWMDDGH